MRKRGNSLNERVVAAIDRASQAQYQLEALIERVEEAICQEQEAIRAAVLFEGGVNTMAHKLLHSLQQAQRPIQPWERVALDEVLTLIDSHKLARRIWPQLRPAKNREERTA